ncbi:15.3 kDa agnoprotein [Human adenovirus 7]|uniref:15.3 kDa agnoprotein n=1 Tax=Human adenovirus B serotype 7 TaxID=10519 RepID=A0A8B0L6L7_ADE07|nr:15.3 kDa agnoprotein [Human adenovirus 7]
MRANREELDLLPPVGGMAVDVMEVELPATRRAFMLVLVQTAAVIAAIHGMHLMNELYLTSFDEKFQWKIEAWRLYLALYYVVCIGMTIFCLDGGHADEPSREASPDLGAAGAELEDESAQAGAVQGPETLRSQVSRQCQEIDLHDLFQGVREVQMVLDLHGSVGGDVNGLQGSVPLGRYHRALVFPFGRRWLCCFLHV